MYYVSVNIHTDVFEQNSLKTMMWGLSLELAKLAIWNLYNDGDDDDGSLHNAVFTFATLLSQ